MLHKQLKTAPENSKNDSVGSVEMLHKQLKTAPENSKNDSVGSVEMLHKQLKTAPKDSKKEEGWWNIMTPWKLQYAVVSKILVEECAENVT